MTTTLTLANVFDLDAKLTSVRKLAETLGIGKSTVHNQANKIRQSEDYKQLIQNKTASHPSTAVIQETQNIQINALRKARDHALELEHAKSVELALLQKKYDNLKDMYSVLETKLGTENKLLELANAGICPGRRNCPHMKNLGRKPTDPEKIKQIKQLRATGMPLRDIAKAVKLSSTSVFQILKRENK